MQERLQKLMAQAGIGSRRACEEIIKEGRVQLNGQRAVLGMKANPQRDQITVDGKPLGPAQALRYLVLHKPRGYITSVEDQFARPSVLDLLVGVQERVYPAGRLDYDSEGLVFLTNDGALAYQVMHPKFQVAKTYLVQVAGEFGPAAAEQLRRGVLLEDGPSSPAQVEIIKSSAQASWLRMTITEGRNRQIRRMAKRVGFSVLCLRRIKIGPLQLKGLQPGQYRDLTSRELAHLQAAVLTGH